jgi:molecular chaperone GrpE
MSDQGKQDGNGEPTPHRLSDTLEEGAAAIPVDAVAEAKSEADKMKNEYLYLRAEFENFKKNAVKERSDLRKYGNERLVVDLLNVLDIFETALSPANAATTPEAVANFRKGIEMTATELKSVLNRHGVTDVVSKGQAFDPTMHEALSSEETSELAPGLITQVFKKPYKLHDRVIRPGQVVVAKAKS